MVPIDPQNFQSIDKRRSEGLFNKFQSSPFVRFAPFCGYLRFLCYLCAFASLRLCVRFSVPFGFGSPAGLSQSHGSQMSHRSHPVLWPITTATMSRPLRHTGPRKKRGLPREIRACVSISARSRRKSLIVTRNLPFPSRTQLLS